MEIALPIGAGQELWRPTIVLHPALPQWHGPLGPVITDGLAEGREVILFDGRGISASSGTPRNRMEEMADDIAAVIRALGLTQVDLLGLSIGGFQAQEVTLRHPNLVRKLILLGTGPRGDGEFFLPRSKYSECIYPDAGHGVQYQYPQRFLRHTIQFLEE
jgi:pimeloyl-ACP methyl ester carboxylesterase